MSPHICYALSTNGEPHYGDLLAISANAVKRLYPEARITILTDDQSWGPAKSLADELAVSVQSAGQYRGSARVRSRFVKTRARSIVDGDFLFLDADTLAVKRFDRLFACETPIAAALNRSGADREGVFPSDLAPYFKRLNWPLSALPYLNSGIVFWRDCPMARELAELWHSNWRSFFECVENPMDQAAFNHSIASLGVMPAIIDDRFNFWPGLSPHVASDPCIYHFHAHSDDMPEGTILDLLLDRYRASGQIDCSPIDAVVRRRHPWLSHLPGKAGTQIPVPTPIAPTAVEQLPAVPLRGPIHGQWDGVEGLVVRRLEASAIGLLLTVSTTMGRHRLGIKFRGIESDRVYRVSAWLKAASPINAYLEMRDDQALHCGKAAFKLYRDAAYGGDPDIMALGVTAEVDGWTRVWAEMTFTGDVAVAYLWLANALGKTEFLGDGRAGLTFGGIDIADAETYRPHRADRAPANPSAAAPCWNREPALAQE